MEVPQVTDAQVIAALEDTSKEALFAEALASLDGESESVRDRGADEYRRDADEYQGDADEYQGDADEYQMDEYADFSGGGRQGVVAALAAVTALMAILGASMPR